MPRRIIGVPVFWETRAQCRHKLQASRPNVGVISIGFSQLRAKVYASGFTSGRGLFLYPFNSEPLSPAAVSIKICLCLH